MKKNINHQLLSTVVVQRLQQNFSSHIDAMTLETDKLFLWVINIFLKRIENISIEKERYLRYNFSLSLKENEVICIECDETKDYFLSNPTLIPEEAIQVIKNVVEIFNSLPQYRAVFREKECVNNSKLIFILGI